MWLLVHDLGETESLYVNGHLVAENVPRDAAGHEFQVTPALLPAGTNVVAVISTPRKQLRRGEGDRNPGGPVVVKVVTPAGEWKRSVFDGLAQVIVQSSHTPGEIKLTASGDHLSPATVTLQSRTVEPRPSVP